MVAGGLQVHVLHRGVEVRQVGDLRIVRHQQSHGARIQQRLRDRKGDGHAFEIQKHTCIYLKTWAEYIHTYIQTIHDKAHRQLTTYTYIHTYNRY